MNLLGRSLDARVLAGTLMFIGAAMFLASVTFGETLAPGYDIHEQPISDLGIIPETALLFNLSLLILGALMIASGLILHRASPARLVTALYLAVGIGVIGVGLFDLNSAIHGLFALISFVSINLLAIAVATKVRGPMRLISALAGVIGLIGLGLHINEMNGALGPGGMERVIVYPPIIWLLTYSGYLMSRNIGDAKAG